MYSEEDGYYKVKNERAKTESLNSKTKYIYFLSNLGYTIKTCGTPENLLEEISDLPPLLILVNNKFSLKEVLETEKTIPILYIANNNYEISHVLADIKKDDLPTFPIIFRRANDPIDTIFETIRFMLKTTSKIDLLVDDKKETAKIRAY